MKTQKSFLSLNSEGEYINSLTFGGNKKDYPIDIFFRDNNIYIFGIFNGSVDFDTSDSEDIKITDYSKSYIWKYTPKID